MNPLASVLEEHPFFKGMVSAELTRLAENASNATFQPGEWIFRAGAPATDFYLLREGEVALMPLDTEPDAVPVQTLRGGDALGWSWLVPPHRFEFGALATTPIRAVRLTSSALLEEMHRDPEMGCAIYQRIVHMMLGRLQATRQRLLQYLHAEGQ